MMPRHCDILHTSAYLMKYRTSAAEWDEIIDISWRAGAQYLCGWKKRDFIVSACWRLLREIMIWPAYKDPDRAKETADRLIEYLAANHLLVDPIPRAAQRRFFRTGFLDADVS